MTELKTKRLPDLHPSTPPTFHGAHGGERAQQEHRSPGGRRGRVASQLVLSHYPADKKQKSSQRNALFIPLTCSHISAQPVCVCVCVSVRARELHRRSQRGLRGQTAAGCQLSLCLLARSHLPGQSGARMAERKPITRSFPPDPRLLPNGQVFPLIRKRRIASEQ